MMIKSAAGSNSKAAGDLMRRVVVLLVACLALTVPRAVSTAQRPSAPASAAEYRTLLDRYCAACHNERQNSAGLRLDTVNLTNIQQHAEILEKVLLTVRVGTMPPKESFN